jgi:UDP-4-amino-4,6-dideoxy-N-acetyl-beta-L-altrosamine transaminase
MSRLDTYSCQTIDPSDIESVVSVLNSDFLTQGPMVAEFEKSLASLVGANHACAVSSATAALHLGLVSMDVGKGDHVWTTPNTFVATVNAAVYCGATVTLIDIDPDTLNIDLTSLERELEATSKTRRLPKVIIPVHFGGNPVDSRKLSSLSDKYEFKILEDASHALGSNTQYENIGQCQFSDAAVFSFHPVKPLTSGEGGAVVTNSNETYQKLCQLRSHGIDKNAREPTTILPADLYYEQTQLGWNYRLSDIHAALGNSQLKKLKSTVEYRQFLREIYLEQLDSEPVKFQKIEDESLSSNHLLVVQFETSLKRNAVYNALKAQGIASNFHYIPIYRQPLHHSIGNPTKFPVMEKYYATGLSLPLHVKLTETEILQVTSVIKEVLRK